jgi:hypothetical protein
MKPRVKTLIHKLSADKYVEPLSWNEFIDIYIPKLTHADATPLDIVIFIINNIHKIKVDDYETLLTSRYFYNLKEGKSDKSIIAKVAKIMIEHNIAITDRFVNTIMYNLNQIIKLIDNGVKIDIENLELRNIPVYFTEPWIEEYKKRCEILKDCYAKKLHENHMKSLSPALVAFNAMSIHGNNEWNRNRHFINATVNNIIQKRKNLKNNNITRKGIKNLIKKGTRFNNRGYPLNDLGVEESKNSD